MDEDTSLAVLLAYKGRKRHKDYLAMAEAVRFLKMGDGSFAAVAKRLGGYYDRETLRALASLLDLPAEAKELVATRQLGYEAHKLLQVHPQSRQVELANKMVGLSTTDTRGVIEYVKRNPAVSVEECTKRVLESKTTKEKLYVVIVPLQEDAYLTLKDEAETRAITVDRLVEELATNWIRRRRRSAASKQ